MEKIFEKIIDIVSEHTGINRERILCGKCEEQVNARMLLVYNLSRIGFTDKMIAQLTGLTRQGVNKCKNSYHSKTKQTIFIATISQRITNHIDNEFANG